MSQSGQAEKGPAEYGREALSQWVDAARYGARALAARRELAKDKPRLIERLDPTKTEKGGKAGDLADLALSKLGSPGRLASKVKLGSRLVERVTPSGEKKAPTEEGEGDSEIGRPTRAEWQRAMASARALPCRSKGRLTSRFRSPRSSTFAPVSRSTPGSSTG